MEQHSAYKKSEFPIPSPGRDGSLCLSRPLEGKRILVTRPKGQASQLGDKLVELGAIPVQLPAIEIVPPEDYAPLDATIRNLPKFDWVVFTSVNGVSAVAARMDQIKIARSALSDRKIAVIGPSTASAVTQAFRAPDLVPHEFVSEALTSTLGEVKGLKFALLRGDIARKDLPIELKVAGAEVHEITVYRIISDDNSRLADTEPMPDYITLTSSSSALATMAKLREAGHEGWLRKVPIACIGPITAKTVRDMGYKVAVGSDEYTIPGLVEAIVKHSKGIHA